MTGCHAASSFYGNQIKKTGSHVNIRVRNISIQDEADFLFTIYKSISACPITRQGAKYVSSGIGFPF